MKRAVGIVGAAALTLGMVAMVPTAAHAAPNASISGTVNAPKGTKVKWGSITVYDSKCNWVGYDDVTWKGNKFTVKGLQSGKKYKIQYSNYVFNSKARYGASKVFSGGANSCSGATTVKAGSKKANLSLKPNGKVQVTGVKIKSKKTYGDSIVFYDVKTGKEWLGSAWGGDGLLASGDIAPGKYKVALVRTSYKNYKTKVLKVAGTKSKKVSKGKTITVKSGKAISLNFSKGTATSVKDFAFKAKGKITGTAKAGKKLTAKVTKMPKGTSLKYQWYVNGKKAKNGKGKTYKVKSKDRGKEISVRITATKRGYNVGYFGGYKVVKLDTLKQKKAQKITRSDTTLKATAATFNKGGVKATYEWYVDGGSVGSGKSFDAAGYEGNKVELRVTYSKKYYKTVTKKSSINVPAAPAPAAEAPVEETEAPEAPPVEESNTGDGTEAPTDGAEAGEGSEDARPDGDDAAEAEEGDADQQ